MERFFFVVLTFVVSLTANAYRIEDTLQGPSGLSPVRPPTMQYDEIIKHHELFSQWNSQEYVSVYSARRSYKKAEWQKAPEVQSDELARLFLEVRDRKFMKDSKGRDRRLSWLFPDNGCFARAELMADEAARLGVTKPAKIFVFGNLSVDTDFHPDGKVTWWYHVAPVVRVADDVFVLDPAVDPFRPLLVKEWVSRMNSSVEVSICNTHSYDPESVCDYGGNSQALRAERDQAYFLVEEWERILDLGRSPEFDLGDYPPWVRATPQP